MGLVNCNYEKFTELVKGKEIICYGAGWMLERMDRELSGSDIMIPIKYITDSNPDLWGTSRLIMGERVKIISPKQAFSFITDKIVFLITCGAVDEITDILSKNISENVPVFAFKYMSLAQHDKILIDAGKGLKIVHNGYEPYKIPKKIHYCWFGGNDFSDLHKYCMGSWRKFCPDYEIIEWNETNCDLSENLYAKQAYDAGKYGFVPDYFRLKIIYENGGIYLDTDVELVRNLDALLVNEAYMGFQSQQQVNLGLGFGARKGFPLVREMMETYGKIAFKNDDDSLNLIPSPVYQTEILVRHGLITGGRLQNIDGAVIYPFDVLCTKSMFTGQVYQTDNSFSVHHFDASWTGKQYKETRNRVWDIMDSIIA